MKWVKFSIETTFCITNNFIFKIIPFNRKAKKEDFLAFSQNHLNSNIPNPCILCKSNSNVLAITKLLQRKNS